MTTQEAVVAQLVRANPIPDFDEFEVVSLGATRYLKELEQRSATVTRTQTRPTTNPPPNQKPMLAFVAIAAAVLIGIALAFALGSPNEAVTPSGDSLKGSWKVTSDSATDNIQVNDDGTYVLNKYVRKVENHDDGTFTTYFEDLRVDYGTYSLDGDELRIYREGGRACVAWDSGELEGTDGVYTVAFEGADNATLTLIEDECPQRGNDLDGMTIERAAP